MSSVDPQRPKNRGGPNMTSLSNDISCGRFSRSPLLRPRLGSSSSSSVLEPVVTVLLSIFVFALPTDLRLYGDMSVTLPVGSLCIMLGVLGVMKRQTIVKLAFGSWCLLAFVIWSTSSLAWAEYPNSTMIKLTKYWEYLPMTWVITQYAWDRRIRIRLFDAFLVGCWCGVLGTFFNYSTGREFYIPGANELERRYSFGTDVNYLALALVIGVIIAWYRIYSDRTRWKQFLFLLYIPAAIMAIALTGSRGALLALLAATITFAICTNARKRLTILSGVAAFLMLTLILPSSFTWRLSTTSDEISHGTLDGRRDLWDRGIFLAGENPLHGLGVGATEGALAYPAHNTPLEILIEGGAIGLGFFYGGIVLCILSVRRVGDQEGTALLVICAAWLVGTFSISWDAHPITWFMFAMLLSAGSARRPGRVSGGNDHVMNGSAVAQ
jgi:O-antigen ligase